AHHLALTDHQRGSLAGPLPGRKRPGYGELIGVEARKPGDGIRLSAEHFGARASGYEGLDAPPHHLLLHVLGGVAHRLRTGVAYLPDDGDDQPEVALGLFVRLTRLGPRGHDNALPKPFGQSRVQSPESCVATLRAWPRL